jgi:hypothetical protein
VLKKGSAIADSTFFIRRKIDDKIDDNIADNYLGNSYVPLINLKFWKAPGAIG